MVTKETSRQEIESKLTGMGDYVKIDFLARCLKNNLDFDTRKFVLVNLSVLYEKRNMFNDSARCLRNSAEINPTFNGKINDLTKSAQLFIKGGNYDDAEADIKRALSVCNEIQKSEVTNRLKEFYFEQARNFISKDKRKNAAEIYERLLEKSLGLSERKDVQTKLLNIYSALGKISDFQRMKKSLNL